MPSDEVGVEAAIDAVFTDEDRESWAEWIKWLEDHGDDPQV